MAPRQNSRTRLLDAALKVVRTRGYSATRIEDICAEAGVTKGSFFHHFRSKDDLALAAVAHWDEMTSGLFATAPYHRLADPLDRLLAYVAFRKTLLAGDLPDFTCFVGTIIQEAYRTQPTLVEACERNLSGHAGTLEADIAAAMEIHGVTGDWSASGLALHAQAVIQGSFILAKAKGGPGIAAQSLDHLSRYLALLFTGAEARAVTPFPATATATDRKENAMQKITPTLWFNGNAEEAANFYVGIFPDSRIDNIHRAAADNPSTKKGAVLLVEFTLSGQKYAGLNGGSEFKFTHAVSFSIDCKDQAEVDRYWDALTAGGGSPVQCGWLTDRFGLSWQVVPRRLIELMSSPDRAAAERVMQAMMNMVKLDVAELERAAALSDQPA